MRQLADGVRLLDGFPRDNRNVYVLGDVLVDAGIPLDRRRILRQVSNCRLTAHVLTHAHPDHYGSSHSICKRLGLPLWCGPADVEAVEQGKAVGPGGRMWPGSPAHPVDRALNEGEELAGFVVLDTPGHSPGHLCFWRESDRVLVCGDVMWGYNPFLLRAGVREPPRVLSADYRRNRASARRVAQLEPALICFGHGPPLHDGGRFRAAVEFLPG